MGSAWPALAVSVENIREFFERLDHPSTPVSVGEIAEAMECARPSPSRCLEELAERGKIHTRCVDVVGRVWWNPQQQPQGGQQQTALTQGRPR